MHYSEVHYSEVANNPPDQGQPLDLSKLTAQQAELVKLQCAVQTVQFLKLISEQNVEIIKLLDEVAGLLDEDEEEGDEEEDDEPTEAKPVYARAQENDLAHLRAASAPLIRERVVEMPDDAKEENDGLDLSVNALFRSMGERNEPPPRTELDG